MQLSKHHFEAWNSVDPAVKSEARYAAHERVCRATDASPFASCQITDPAGVVLGDVYRCQYLDGIEPVRRT